MQASLVAQWFKLHLPVQEMQIWSLVQEDPWEAKQPTPDSILA